MFAFFWCSLLFFPLYPLIILLVLVDLDGNRKPKKISAREVLTPKLKVKSESPLVQHIALPPEEATPNVASPGMLSPRKVTSLKRMASAAVKDLKNSETNELKTTVSVVNRVFPSRRTKQSDIMRMADRAHERKHQPSNEDKRYVCSRTYLF